MFKIVEVLKYEGDNSTFIWKHPSEDFNNITQLIVHEGQEAIFVMNGQVADIFGPGRYRLKSENLPILGKLLTLGTGGESPFHCEVYFINKTVKMPIKWGTDSRVRFIEPTYGVPMEVGASGEMSLMVANSRDLLTKLVGNMSGISWEITNDKRDAVANSLRAFFRPMISSAVKSHLGSCITKNNLDIITIDENLGLLSDVLKESIRPGFEEYGITIANFYVTTVLLPEDEHFRKIKEMRTVNYQKKVMEYDVTMHEAVAETEKAKSAIDFDKEKVIETQRAEKEQVIKTAKAESDAAIAIAQRQAILEQEQNQVEIAKKQAERELIEAQAKAQAEAMNIRLAGLADAEVMAAKGYTQKDVLQAEVQQAYAEGIGNMTITGGSGGVAGDMIGLGVGMAAAGAVAPQLGEMFKGMNGAMPNTQTTTEQPSGSATITCPVCNKSVPANAKFCLECGAKIEILNENEVICSTCGKKTQKGKFCMECGASLIATCPKCGVELPTGAKFCLECGEKI